MVLKLQEAWGATHAYLQSRDSRLPARKVAEAAGGASLGLGSRRRRLGPLPREVLEAMQVVTRQLCLAVCCRFRTVRVRVEPGAEPVKSALAYVS